VVSFCDESAKKPKIRDDVVPLSRITCCVTGRYTSAKHSVFYKLLKFDNTVNK